MGFDPLILDPVSPSVWVDFHAGSKLFGPLPPALAHWRRCQQLGADAEGPRPEDALLRGRGLAERSERLAPLIHSGQAVLQRIAAAAAALDYALLVSDGDGVIVSATGGGSFAEQARRVRLMCGAAWSEATRGTNAIGTALAEGRPVFVRGRAHYARSYHGLVCYAAPVRDAAGDIVAVLDATSNEERVDPAMGLGVVAAAKALQARLRLRAYSLAGASITAALARSLERMDCPVAVVEPPGRIERLNAPAQQLFGRAATEQTPQALLGYDFQTLATRARAGARVPLAGTPGGMHHDMHLEPIESDGRLIALLVFFEPSRTSSKPTALPTPAPTPCAFSELFTEDRTLLAALEHAARLAASEIPIMLLAETGAGKELVARGIHRASPRAGGPLVAINCGAISPSLLESELFGYGPGAFTGADRRGRDGYLSAASGGTLFLDEVADMPLPMQASLLRFLENGLYQRVGESEERKADVRVVCATCRDLPTLVATGGFRTDLYYRLKGVTVTLPPLRARSDIVALARHLLTQLASAQRIPQISASVESFLALYPWPGNVRELKSSLEVALVLSGSAQQIELQHLPPELGERVDLPAESLDEVQLVAIRRVLSEVAGNVSRAANKLGIARSTLYRRMRRYGLVSESES